MTYTGQEISGAQVDPKAQAKAAKAYAKATRPWFKKKRWWAVGAVAIMIIAGAAGGAGGGEDKAPVADSTSNEAKESQEKDKAPSGRADQGAENEAAGEVEQSEPEMTSGQENALEAGQNYIDMMPFSKDGLIGQLSSNYGDGYSKADATFAANHVEVDWNAEAVEAAQNYMDTMPMSRDQLIEQLSSNFGDKFTVEQATYAVNQVY